MNYVSILLLLVSTSVFAAPFDTCPSKAFLVQQGPAKLFGVNLVTGSYNQLAENLGTSGKVNGFGFSVHDRYLYGWGYEAKGLVRIGNDYQVEPLEASGFPNTSFYVGDVAVNTNHYYSYRRGSSYGLYRTSLDENDADYLVAVRVIDGSSLNLNIYDLAFHPSNGFAYSVDGSGNLYQINVDTGSASNIGNVGHSGTFGAVYFDVEGNFYISRNSDGHVYKIDISLATPAQLFAYGPSSSSNDGARCATAPIIDDSEDPTIDFGDAPDSFGTSLSANGARHGVTDLYLGSGVSAEYTPNVNDDLDDGVLFVTSFETGLDALITITASQDGYVNAWFDWDQNQTFSEDEKLLDGYWVTAGTNQVLVEVPSSASSGTIWSRFRLSSQQSINPTGGVENGEVEDYQVVVTATGVTQYASGWVTAAYEDFWPEQGDYDFNDVVVRYRVLISQINNQVVRYTIEGNLVAVGANFHNGFAVRFKDILRSDVNENLIRYEINQQQQTSSPLEAGRNEAILIIFPDTRAIVPVSNGCSFFRTQSSCASQSTIPFKITLPLLNPYDPSVASTAAVDPFIFGVNGFNHGDFVNANNARGWEVHLKNQSPTEAFDASYLDIADDRSSTNGYYQTENGLPWAMVIGTSWSHPQESRDLVEVYPQFEDFAQSNGQQNATWFFSPVQSLSISNVE